MPLDVEDVTDRVGEYEGIASETTPTAQDIQGLHDLADKVANEMKAQIPSIEFKMDFDEVNKTVKTTISAGGTPVEIKVTGPDGKPMSYAEAITDPNVPAGDVVDAFKSACEKVGLSIPDDVAAQMQKRVELNPTRDYNESLQRDASRANEPDIKNDPVISSDTFKNADATYDKADPSGKQQLAKDLNAQIAESPAIKEINSKLDKLTEKAKDPTWKDKLTKWLADKVDTFTSPGFLALVAAGVLTYELIKGYQNELKGCWQATSSGSSVNKGKIQALTCDDCCKNTGSDAALTTVCDPSVTPPPSGLTQCVSCGGDPNGCKIGSACEGGESGNLCSGWCSNAVRILNDNKGNSNSYACNDPSFADTVANIAGNVDDAISDLLGEAKNFFSNLLKYGLYVILFIVGLVLLYLAYKFISPIFSHHPEQQHAPSHEY